MQYLKYILHLPKILIVVHGLMSQFLIHLLILEGKYPYWYRVNAEEVPLNVKQAVLVQSNMLRDSKACWLSKKPSKFVVKEACLTGSVWLALNLQGNTG